MAAQDTGNLVPGFRTFWETSKRKAAARNLTFVQVDVEQAGGSRKDKKKPKGKGKGKQAVSEPTEAPDSDPQSPTNRRHQVYQAQKRHRRRKAEYAQSLEAEIAKIKDQHYKASEDAQRLASENAEISSYLVSQGFLSGSDQIPFVQTSSMEQEVLDPDLALECPNLSELSSGLDSESDGALSSLDEAPLSSCRDKSYILLKESDFPDPQTDALSRSKIKQCRDLLLESVHPFQNDEREEEKTWKKLSDIVLDER